MQKHQQAKKQNYYIFDLSLIPTAATNFCMPFIIFRFLFHGMCNLCPFLTLVSKSFKANFFLIHSQKMNGCHCPRLYSLYYILIKPKFKFYSISEMRYRFLQRKYQNEWYMVAGWKHFRLKLFLKSAPWATYSFSMT